MISTGGGGGGLDLPLSGNPLELLITILVLVGIVWIFTRILS